MLSMSHGYEKNQKASVLSANIHGGATQEMWNHHMKKYQADGARYSELVKRWKRISETL